MYTLGSCPDDGQQQKIWIYNCPEFCCDPQDGLVTVPSFLPECEVFATSSSLTLCTHSFT